MRIITADQAKAEKVSGQVILVTAGNPVITVDSDALFIDGEMADGGYFPIQFDTAAPDADLSALMALIQAEAQNEGCETVIVTAAPDADARPYQDFYGWYDNGSGFWEANPAAFPVKAQDAQDALAKVGEGGCGYGACITDSAKSDPNFHPELILAGGNVIIYG